MYKRQALQYAGGSLPPKDLSLLLEGMPLGNQDVAFSSLNKDYKIADSMIRSLDKGYDVDIDPLGEDIQFMMTSLVYEIKQDGFRDKPYEIQQLFRNKLAQYQEVHANQLAQQMELNKGMIPTGGPMVKISGMYVPNPNKSSSKTVVPFRISRDTLMWVDKRLKEQGTTQEQLIGQDMASQEAIMKMAQQIAAQQQGGGQQPQELEPVQPEQLPMQ